MLKITFILLAAGHSSRFGSDKLMAKMTSRKTMLETSAEKILSVSNDILAVVAPNQLNRIDILKQLNIKTQICQHAHLGMGVSLAEAVKASATSDGWIICLADMLYIKIETLEKVNQQMLNGAVVTAPYYQNQRGHPVGINNEFFDQLVKLDSDQGAKSIIQKHLHQLIKIPTSDSGVLKDIDKLSDLI